MLNDVKGRPNPARIVIFSTGKAQRDVKEGPSETLDVIQHRGCQAPDALTSRSASGVLRALAADYETGASRITIPTWRAAACLLRRSANHCRIRACQP